MATRHDRHAAERPPLAVVLPLAPREDAQVDGDRLVEMVVRLGEAGARQRLGAVMDGIGAATGAIYGALQSGRFDRVSASALGIRQDAIGVGLTSVTEVAGALAGAAEVGDDIACAALLHRLARLSTASARSCGAETADPG